MKLTIRTHKTTAFDDFHDHAEKRLARLEHLLPRVDDVVVEVGHEETRSASHRYAVQVTVHAGTSILRAEERGADPRVALDVVADVLARQARRHGKRLRDRNHANVTKEVAAAAALSAPVGGPELDDEVDEYVLGRVVRAKHFEAKPMSQEEALAQMDLIGHDFFLFLDSASNDYALLYKRKDGDYGLLAPRRA
jgi:ribosome hibernation promoting factor